MRKLLLAVLALALFAPMGGSTGAGFTAPRQVGAGSEPGLLVDAAGAVWVHAPGSLWRGGDSGFAPVNLGGGPVIGGDADLVTAPDGSLYYADLAETATINVWASHDHGATWTFVPAASETTADDRNLIIYIRTV